MAISNSSVFLTIVLLLNIINNVKSDTFSFTFPNFDPETVGLDGDASISAGTIQLTKRDKLGNPLQHSVGLAGFSGPVRLYNKNTGRFSFSTDFSFVVNRRGSDLHGDGMTFFLASPDFDFPENNSSDGGLLGLFTPQTAFNNVSGKNTVVAVEFDSYGNEWDPNPNTQSPHIGVNINSIRSVATTGWPSDDQRDGEIARANINYDSDSLILSASVSYPNSKTKEGVLLNQEVDFTEVLPEWVVIGFSAATGELVETHEILSWDYTSST